MAKSKWGWIIVAATQLLLAGCQESSTTVCESGRVCAAGTVCDELIDACLLPGQRDACEGIDDAVDCTP